MLLLFCFSSSFPISLSLLLLQTFSNRWKTWKKEHGKNCEKGFPPRNLKRTWSDRLTPRFSSVYIPKLCMLPWWIKPFIPLSNSIFCSDLHLILFIFNTHSFLSGNLGHTWTHLWWKFLDQCKGKRFVLLDLIICIMRNRPSGNARAHRCIHASFKSAWEASSGDNTEIQL